MNLSSLETRLLKHISKTEYCWEWTGCKRDGRYGSIKIGGRHQQAHRIVYELYNGPIPQDMWVLHSCDNPGCVNPEHLFLGNYLDNVRDRTNKGRGYKPKGVLHYNARLTNTIVLSIRAEYQEGNTSQHKLALKYGVSRANIYYIVKHKTWKHLP